MFKTIQRFQRQTTVVEENNKEAQWNIGQCHQRPFNRLNIGYITYIYRIAEDEAPSRSLTTMRKAHLFFFTPFPSRPIPLSYNASLFFSFRDDFDLFVLLSVSVYSFYFCCFDFLCSVLRSFEG